ncbi:solute carrier family 35 member F2-like isoform X2 [Papaver somniferum]|uniref:solute carrier family 35 member F2-like isoform X2 n=1 Tax=Papaver somniferum TaxID=3469 RepID=UPI000E6FE639|nr:solute carrier family 35 member F2-like isoform X2 [Papaver somniferum]
MLFDAMIEWRNKNMLGVIFVLFLGQLVSTNLAVNSFTSSLLANHSVNAPLTQVLLCYTLLALVYTPIVLYRRQKLAVPWYWYLLLGFIDVQGNLCGTRYSICQFFGAAICMAGLCLVVFSDSVGGASGGKHPLLGDGLVIAGLGMEYCVKKKDLVEVLSMLGIFGMLVSICQICLMEKNNLEAIRWSPEIISLFGSFMVSAFVFYSTIPYVLKLGGAVLFNLSLLTSDVWGVMIRVFVFHQNIQWLYYVSFITVGVGLVIYSTNDQNSITTTNVENENQNENDNSQYQLLDEENKGVRGQTAIT